MNYYETRIWKSLAQSHFCCIRWIWVRFLSSWKSRHLLYYSNLPSMFPPLYPKDLTLPHDQTSSSLSPSVYHGPLNFPFHPPDDKMLFSKLSRLKLKMKYFRTKKSHNITWKFLSWIQFSYASIILLWEDLLDDFLIIR